MFRSSSLIKEVRKKPMLWAPGYKQPSEKGFRAEQWLEVAKNLFPDWNLLNVHVKRERVESVKRKWKNIRDYYKKGSKRWNSRQYVYSHLLDEFLGEEHAAKNNSSSIQTEEIDIPPITLEKTEISECQDDELTQNESMCGSEDIPIQEFIISEHFSLGNEVTPSAPSTATERCLQIGSHSDEEYDSNPVPPKKKCQYNDECMDADRCFLLSLLPEMRNMNGLEKVGFKMSVLNELSSIMRQQQNFQIKEEPYS